MFNSQAGQDQFILHVLKNKKNGYFLEIGSNHPISINNTYILEQNFGWNGLMVEYDHQWEKYYKQYRTSNYIIQDATKIDYRDFFEKNNFPKNMDYLQIDLEVSNGSTINTLELLDRTVFPDYTFSVVTFEHDIYTGNHFDTRLRSREIFERNMYVLVFKDVKNMNNSFEDWYVHPYHVDMDYINKIKKDEPLEWSNIIKIL